MFRPLGRRVILKQSFQVPVIVGRAFSDRQDINDLIGLGDGVHDSPAVEPKPAEFTRQMRWRVADSPPRPLLFAARAAGYYREDS